MPWFDDPRDNPVQAAQNEYLDTMAGHEARVAAGEITAAEYRRTGEPGGETFETCRAKINAAIAAYEAEHPTRLRRPNRRERSWQRGHARDQAHVRS